MASNTIGIKINLDGEKEFKKSISNINSEMKVLKSEMKLVDSEFSENKNSVEALTKKNKVLTDEISAQEKKVDLLNSALENAREKYGENDDRTNKWKVSLNNAKSELNKLNNELEDNQRELKKAEEQTDDFNDELKDTGEASDKAEGGLDNFIGSVAAGFSAGAIVSGAINILEGIADTIIQVGEAAVDAAEKIKELADATAEQGDTIDKMSQRLGMSREAYQKWSYVMSQNDIEIDSLQSGIKTFTNAIDDARNGTQSAIDKFERLGLSMDDVNTKSREELFEQAIYALQEVSDETEKAAEANDLFGRSGSELTPLLNQSADATQALLDKTSELGLIMSDEAIDNSVAYSDAMDSLTRSLDGVRNSVMINALPALQQFADGAAKYLGNISNEIQAKGDDWEAIGEIVSDKLADVINIINDHLPEILEKGAEMFAKLVDGFIKNKDKLQEAFQKIQETWNREIIKLLPIVLEAGGKLVVALAKGFIEATKTNWNTALNELGVALGRKMSELINKMTSIGQNIVQGIINGIKQKTNNLLGVMGDLCKSMINIVKNKLGIHSPSQVFADEVGTNIALGIGEGYNDTMAQVNEDMANAIDTSAFDAVTNVSADMSTSANQAASAAGKAVKIEIPLIIGKQKLATAVYEGLLSQDYTYNIAATI